MTFNEFLKFRDIKIRDQNHKKIVKLFYPYLSSVSGDIKKLPNLISSILNIDLSNATAITGCFNKAYNKDCPYKNTDFYILFDSGVKVFVYGSAPAKSIVKLNKDEYAIFVIGKDLSDNIKQEENNQIYIL